MSKIEVKCTVCGKPKMMTFRAISKNTTGTFYCGRECMKVGNSGSGNPFYGRKHSPEFFSKASGKNHWNYGNRKEEQATCGVCGISFVRNYKHRGIYCSESCMRQSRRKRIERPCSWCGKLVERSWCYRNQEHFFCNYSCLGKWNGNNQPTGDQSYWHGKRREETPNWRGGLSFEPYGIEFNNDLKQEIRERDDFHCQLCGTKQGEIQHDVHHIDYDKSNNDEQNLISLCRSCHTKTNGNRDYWIQFFQSQNKAYEIESVTTIPTGSTLQAYGSGSTRHPFEFRKRMMI